MSFNWKSRMQLENAKKCFIYLIFWSETLSGKWNECKYFKCDLAAESGSVGGKTSPITVSDGSSQKNTLPLHLNSSDGVCWVLLRSKQRNTGGKRVGKRSCCKGKSSSSCYYFKNDELNKNRTNGRQFVWRNNNWESDFSFDFGKSHKVNMRYIWMKETVHMEVSASSIWQILANNK